MDFCLSALILERCDSCGCPRPFRLSKNAPSFRALAMEMRRERGMSGDSLRALWLKLM
jgi:hypothetical protein